MPDDLTLEPPPRVLYGDVTLHFCSAKNGRPCHEYYRETPDGLVLVDGVTTACGIIDKSMYLIPWACKMMALRLAAQIPVEDGQVMMGAQELLQLIDAAKRTHKEILDDAGDVGGLAHGWIEESIKHAIEHTGGVVVEMDTMAPTDERAYNCGMAAYDWMQLHNVRWICTERMVYSKKYNYAGTLDGLAWIDSCEDQACCQALFIDRLCVIDWKSSNQLRIDYAYQTAAYLGALLEEFGDDLWEKPSSI